MTPDQERWAEALAVERMHGDDSPRFIAERIGELAIAGDWKGVEGAVSLMRTALHTMHLGL